jgi:triacylglycerol esterase/lipase EstA (alpha/beta hydrolase family)
MHNNHTIRILAALIPIVLIAVIGGGILWANSKAHAATYTPSTSWPVVFIHGFEASGTDCNSQWGTAISYLQGSHPSFNSGQSLQWTGPLTSLGYYSSDTNCTANLADNSQQSQQIQQKCANYYDSNVGSASEDIRHLACEVAWYLYNNYSQNTQNVQIVAHSMGGLIIRYAIYAVHSQIDPHFPPKLYVQDVVTLDTPQGGLSGSTTTALAAIFLCAYCNQVIEMENSSDFMTELSKIEAQSPQATNGTDWTMLGSQGTKLAGLYHCDFLSEFEGTTATDMNGGHKYVYYSPCYGHSDFKTDNSDTQDATVNYCDQCTATPSNWTRITKGQRSLLRMLYALTSQNW